MFEPVFYKNRLLGLNEEILVKLSFFIKETMGCFQSTDNILIEELTKSPFFSLDVANSQYLASLAKRFIKRTYGENEKLWNKGDVITSFNIIIEGEVILKFHEDDKSIDVEIEKEKGQCFGFHALRHITADMTSSTSTESERESIGVSYDCIAMTELTVYQITADRLIRCCDLQILSLSL